MGMPSSDTRNSNLKAKNNFSFTRNWKKTKRLRDMEIERERERETKSVAVREKDIEKEIDTESYRETEKHNKNLFFFCQTGVYSDCYK